MNSGQAPASDAGHSMLSVVKGKQQSKNALAASLAGSLFSLIPGAVTVKSGFKSTMQQIMEGRRMPGTRLTRKPWISGKGSAKGSNILRTAPGISASRSSGLTDPHVLELSEAARGSLVHQHTEVNGKQVPSSTPTGIQQANGLGKIGTEAGTALKTANQPNGSIAGSTALGNSSDGLLESKLSGNQVGSDNSPSPKSKPAPIEGAADVRALREGHVGEASINKSSETVAELANLNRGEVNSSPANVVRSTRPKGISRSAQLSHPDGSPSKEKSERIPNANHNRIRILSNRTVHSGNPTGLSKQSPVGTKSVHTNSHSAQLTEIEQSGLASSLKQGNSEDQISSQGYRKVPTTPEIIIRKPSRRELREDGTIQGFKGRITNQQGLKINHTSPTSGGRLATDKPVPDLPGSDGIHGKQAAQSKAGAVGNAGSNHISSLTDQNVSRDITIGNEVPAREFVKPVAVGIHEVTQYRKQSGKELHTLIGKSLLAPTQSTNEMSAALGSLARITASQYLRFVNNEQPNSVFTFNGGTLGNVQLSFRETNSGTVLHIVVESPEIRNIVQRTLPSLEQDWIQEGLEFSDVNVEVGDTGYQWVSSGMEDETRIPTLQQSEETISVVPEIIEQAIKDYGYNTLEFVA